MQVTQLSMKSRKVPKFEAKVMVRNEFGRAAILSWVRYPKLDKKPCGNSWIAESAGAAPSPKYITTVMQPTMADMVANVQMARCGVRFRECSIPLESGNSLSLPMA